VSSMAPDTQETSAPSAPDSGHAHRSSVSAFGASAPPAGPLSSERGRPESSQGSEETGAWERRSAWLLLRQRDFRLYFLGALFCNLGTWLQSTAQILIAYQVTHSTFVVGLITSAQFAGMILVSPWAAVLVDKFGSKSLLIGTQGASAVIVLWMAWRYHTNTLGVHTLIFSALALGLAYSLALPVQTALVPALVGPAEATSAIKMNSASYNAGRALAPALCVPVVIVAGTDFIFALNAASFVIFAICLAATAGRLKPADPNFPVGTTSVTEGPPSNEHTRVTDGLMAALREPRIFLLLGIVAAVTLADDPILVLSPALAHTKFHLSSEWTGLFIAALGWGSVLGSVIPTSTKIHSSQGASRRAAISLLFLGGSVIVFMMGLWGPFSLIAASLAGAAGLFTGSAAQTALMRQKINPTSVAALWAIAWAGSKPLASLADGWLASNIGIWVTSITMATPAIFIGLCEIFLPKRAKRHIRQSANLFFSYCAAKLSAARTREKRSRRDRSRDTARVYPASAGEPSVWPCDSCGHENDLWPHPQQHDWAAAHVA
jgi:MFS family permease